MSGEKKERVLHTRIPHSLDAELKTRAEKLGISVSNLVRNVLTNAFDMVEDIVADASRIRAAAQAVPRTPSSTSPDVAATMAPGVRRVLGWQSIVLQVNALCDKCNEILPRGTRAFLAVQDGPAVPVFRCPSCVECIEESRDDDRP